MRTELFDYDLPVEFIAQEPAQRRDESRLLVLHRVSGQIEHRRFRDLQEYLRVGDLLVANDSRVIPARLRARKSTGGRVELLLLRKLDEVGQEWECLVRGRHVREGTVLFLDPWDGNTRSLHGSPAPELQGEIVSIRSGGTRVVRFIRTPDLDIYGTAPLPPYIRRYVGDAERYQTVYSREEGSAAAPTAGLHFTPERLIALRNQGVHFTTVTLHIGLDTFRPVESEQIEDHLIHSEWAELSPTTAQRINEITLAGGRIIAVGTTTVRTLEWAATRAQGIDPYDPSACPWQRTAAFAGDVDLLIYPPYRFRAIDALITNFHLPRSSLLMMVSAFVGQPYLADVDVGRRLLLEAYEIAKGKGYRFYSFGDAMLIL